MQASEKAVRKPMLSSQGKTSADSYEKKLSKVEIFYRYPVCDVGTTSDPSTGNSSCLSTKSCSLFERRRSPRTCPKSPGQSRNSSKCSTNTPPSIANTVIARRCASNALLCSNTPNVHPRLRSQFPTIEGAGEEQVAYEDLR
jgi:hypothetical protein